MTAFCALATRLAAQHDSLAGGWETLSSMHGVLLIIAMIVPVDFRRVHTRLSLGNATRPEMSKMKNGNTTQRVSQLASLKPRDSIYCVLVLT